MKPSKKCVLPALLLSVLGATSSAAFAVPITDVNNYGNSFSGQLIDSSTGFTDQFKITPAYNPATQTVTSASATFDLWDSIFGGSESVSINLGSTSSWQTNGSFFGDITLGGALVGSLLVDLSTDGIISYTVRETGSGNGSFYLEKATLTADVSNRVTSAVPEPATLALLGLGLAGLGFSRRKQV